MKPCIAKSSVYKNQQKHDFTKDIFIFSAFLRPVRVVSKNFSFFFQAKRFRPEIEVAPKKNFNALAISRQKMHLYIAQIKVLRFMRFKLYMLFV